MSTTAARIIPLAVAVVLAMLEDRPAFAQSKAGMTEVKLPREIGQSMTIEIPGLPAESKKLELVLVPGMGKVQPFLMGKYEITQGQYQALMHTNPSTHRTGPDYPVEQVSWQEAKDFCAQLSRVRPASERTNISFRLPTDEEWSIAVGLPAEKGRTPGEKNRKVKGVYPWGSEWPPPADAGNYSDSINQKAVGGHDGFADTAPVGSYPPNASGLYDLGGNVWEWCEDWFDEEENVRVLRGGGFFTTSEGQILSSSRGRPPVVRNYGSGLRVRLEVIAP